MARIRKMSIVTTGTQKGGQVVTKEMLESAIANFNKDARPPVVRGHPEKGDDQYPSYGRVGEPQLIESVDRPGEWELIIEVHYTDHLEHMEDSLEFEGFSIGLYPCEGREGWYIHHLAILGGLPPGADTKTLEVVQLSALPDGKNAILLSAVILKESILDMKEDELVILVTKTVEAAMKGVTAPIVTTLEVTKLDASKSTTDVINVESAEVKDLKTQLAQVQEMTKSTRIDEIKTLAQTKEMSDAELKPIVDTLEAADAVTLCDSSTAGIFANMKRIVEAKPAKATVTGQGLFQGLTPVNLAAPGASDAKDFDPMSVAQTSGF